MMKRPIPEDQIWKYFIQVVLGIQALHGMKILHRDIKPGNIMVFETGMAKVRVRVRRLTCSAGILYTKVKVCVSWGVGGAPGPGMIRSGAAAMNGYGLTPSFCNCKHHHWTATTSNLHVQAPARKPTCG